MGFKNRVTNITPMIPGATSVITIGTGGNAPTMDKLQLTLSAATGTFNTTKINGIRGYVNGKECYVDKSATVLNSRRTYQGLNVTTAELNIELLEMNARSQVEQNLSSWPLALMQDCRFELDIDATASAAMKIDAVMHFRAPTRNPFIKKKRRTQTGLLDSGRQSIYVPNGGSGGKLVRVWVHESVPGNINSVELRARNAIGIECSRVQLENDQKDWGLVPQAGVVVLDFIADGNLSGWFDTAALSDVELTLNGTAQASYEIFYEYLDPIGGL